MWLFSALLTAPVLLNAVGSTATTALGKALTWTPEVEVVTEGEVAAGVEGHQAAVALERGLAETEAAAAGSTGRSRSAQTRRGTARRTTCLRQ